MVEQKDKEEFLDLYRAYQEAKKQDQQTTALTFDINNFDVNTRNREYNRKAAKYTKEQVRRFVADPILYERQLREVSLYLYAFSQEYKNLIKYMSNILTLDYILIPKNIDKMTELNDKLINNFYKMLEFLDNYNIKSKLKSVLPILLREDIYYAFERTDGDSYIWQQLPTNYCRPLGVDQYELITFEFDFSYFDKRNVNIENYDPELKSQYNKYKKNGQDFRWQKINPLKGICFKFEESLIYPLPAFSGLFTQLLGLEDYKDLQEESSRSNNYKLIHQMIPMDTNGDKPDKLLLNDTYAVRFHNNLKSNVPEGIGVATTPMKVEGITLKNSQFDEDIVAKAERNLFTSAGVSQPLFNAEKSTVGLNLSITVDSSQMFTLLKQFELFFKKKLRTIGNKSYKWKLIFPELSVYNKNDFMDKMLKNAQYGFSKFFVVASMGLSQDDFLGLSYLENTQLNILDNLIPLKSSHTISGNEDKIGRPKKDDGSIDDSGVATRESGSNDNDKR